MEPSHFPISCKINKEWIDTEFSRLKSHLETYLLFVNCPNCNTAVNEESKNGRNLCSKCEEWFCSRCMKKWVWNFDRNTTHHNHRNCIQSLNKGETKYKAESSIKQIESLKMDFPKYMMQKIQEEEKLKEIRKYLEEKLEKMKGKNELENEQSKRFILFIDALNGFS